MNFIYLTDEEAFLTTDKGDHLFRVTWKEALSKLDTRITLLLDLSRIEIREEKLPSLFIWDLKRLLRHKRAALRDSCDFFGTQIIREGSEKYLRYVHIPKDDPLSPFIAKSPGRVFFVSLEAQKFLNQTTSPYKILVYPLPHSKVRHVVFKGKRMLLSRITEPEEDLKTTLHYLSRTHSDIFEMFHVKHLEDNKPLLEFIASQRCPTLPFPQKTIQWRKITLTIAVVIISIWIFYEIYLGLVFKNKTLENSLTLSSLTSKIKIINPDKNGHANYKALVHYIHLKTRDADFLKTVQDLFLILEKNQSRLIHFEWKRGKEFDFTLNFLASNNLPEQLDNVLVSLKKAFPMSQVQVIEAPYHSFHHEVFKGMTNDPPLSQIKVVME